MDAAMLRGLLTRLERLPGGVTDVVVIVDSSRPEITELIYDDVPGVRVLQFGETTAAEDRTEILMRSPRPQLIVDGGSGRPRDQLGNFTTLFYFLVEGGLYVVDDCPAASPSADPPPASNLADLLSELAVVRDLPAGADRSQWSPSRQELAVSVGEIVIEDGVAMVEKRLHHLIKLREERANEILTARYGPRWGRPELITPARSVDSRTHMINYGDGPLDPRTSFDVPDLQLRHYSDVLCASFQVAAHGDYLLPDSFRHAQARILGNRHTHYVSPHFSRLKMEFHSGPPRCLPGSYYFLDTEHPGHFGHITTEVLGRYWGWRLAQRAYPGIRLLISSHIRGPIPDFHQTIIGALGIDFDGVEVIRARGPVEVEHLVAATPQFENPHYVDPAITDTWQRLAHGLGLPRQPRPGRQRGRRRRRGIFVSRKPDAKRWCYETTQIERFFDRQGFHVFYPEDLPYQDQAATFAEADVIAGFGGSGMFNMLLNPRAQIVIINGNGYNAENEHLMAAANGNPLHYFWGWSDRQVSDGYNQLEAARSNFSFNLRRHRKDLLRAMRA